MADSKRIASEILYAVGGPDNVTSVYHCMTRLRFTLKDIDLVDVEMAKGVDGVIGAQVSGGQFQVVVGQNVPKVYDEVCALGGFARQVSLDEELEEPEEPEAPEERPTVKALFNNVLNYLSGTMAGLIPALTSAGLFQAIGAVIGPDALGLVGAESGLLVLLDMIYDAIFYFMPIYVGYNAAKQLETVPMLGAIMGAILVAPAFMDMATEGASFTVLGIPCAVNDYSSTVIPALLSVWAMSYVYRFFENRIPESMSAVFTPFLTLLVSIPVALCALAPIGSWLGDLLSTALIALGDVEGPAFIFASALMAALWSPLVISGMHVPLYVVTYASFATTGVDSFILVTNVLMLWGSYGCEIACWFKLRDAREKANALGYAVSNMAGGVGEPWVYGMMFRYRRLIGCSIASAAVAGAVGGALHVKVYVIGMPANVLNILSFVGGGTGNFFNACFAAATGFVCGLVITYLFGFTEDELENGPVSERA